MSPLKLLAAAAGVALGLAVTTEPAAAHGQYRHGYRHGPSVNFSLGYWGGPRYWGPGYWGPGWGYWGPPVAYAPPVVIVPQEPRVWIESDQASAPTPPVPSSSDANAPQWWYWCASARSYYPYVGTCAEGWQRVPPQPTQGTQ